MESQTSTELYERLRNKIQHIKKIITNVSFSSAKERRQFPTEVIPILYLPGSHEHIPTCPFYLRTSAVGRPIVSDIVALLKVCTSLSHAIQIKPSMKVHDSDFPNCTLFDVARKDILQIQSNNTMGTLRQYFLLKGRGSSYDSAMENTIRENRYVQDFLQIIESDAIPSPEQWKQFLERWPQKYCSSSLLERTYIRRGEIRAYVTCNDPCLSLVGSALHSILYLRNSEFRSMPPFCDTSPHNKHLLFLEFSHPATCELTLLFGDISSFTASLKNAWIVLIATIEVLEEENNEGYFVADVGGSLLQCELIELLRNFLFLASAVEVRHELETFVSVGGMLGVSGIDDLFKVTYSLFLRCICRRLKSCVSCIPRCGGDDFLIRLLTRLDSPLSRGAAITYLYTEIGKYMGQIKNFPSLTIAHDSDTVTDLTFCQKQIRIISRSDQEQVHVKMQSQWPIPLMRGLLSLDYGTEGSANKMLVALESVPYVPEKEEIQGGLYALYSLRDAGQLKPLKITKVYDQVWHQDTYTIGAIRLLTEVPIVLDQQGNAYKTTFQSCLSSIPQNTLVRVGLDTAEGTKIAVVGRLQEFNSTTLLEYQPLPPRFSETPIALKEAIRDTLESLFEDKHMPI